jgi:hypothetical protein
LENFTPSIKTSYSNHAVCLKHVVFAADCMPKAPIQRPTCCLIAGLPVCLQNQLIKIKSNKRLMPLSAHIVVHAPITPSNKTSNVYMHAANRERIWLLLLVNIYTHT